MDYVIRPHMYDVGENRGISRSLMQAVNRFYNQAAPDEREQLKSQVREYWQAKHDIRVCERLLRDRSNWGQLRPERDARTVEEVEQHLDGQIATFTHVIDTFEQRYTEVAA